MRRRNSLQDNWKNQGILFSVIFIVIAADQLTKLWVRASLEFGVSQPDQGVLRLTRVANDGGIFGISLPQPVALISPVIVVISILFLFHRYFQLNSWLNEVGVGLVVGGSIGNLIDRLRLGHVTDFIDVRLWNDYHWPSFNIADSAIVVGAFLIVLFLLHMVKSPVQD